MPGDHAEDSVEDCVADVMNQGDDESSAYAICQASVNDKSFSETKLAEMLKSEGADGWVETVERLVRSDVESTVIADVVKRACSGGSRHDARKAMAKSAKLEKVGFEAQVQSEFAIFKAGGDDFVIWGPASVEVVDKEGDKIQSKALQSALPQLLKRARLSLEHSDQLVGQILERFDTEDDIEVEIGDRTFKRSEFPTGVLELDEMEPALYVAGEIYSDSRQSRDTRERIENGELNSYSISGEALVTQKKITSDGETYSDIVDLDLSAVTICEEGMNQKAKFARISDSGEKTAAETAKSDDPVSPASGQGESPTESAVASIVKTAINETMSKNDKRGDNSDGGFNPEALSAEFKAVLDDKLPDGNLATKDDILTREDVEQIVDEYQKEDADKEDEAASEADHGEEDHEDESEASPPDADKEDMADDEDDEDEGHSDAEGHSGGEADYDKAVTALAEVGGIDKEVAEAFLRAFKASDEDRDGDDDYDEESEAEEPGPDMDADDEMKGDEEEPPVSEEEEEVPPPEEEEPPAPEEEEEVPVPEDEMKDDGYSTEELEETLPADVFEVVNEYLDDGGDMPGEEAAPEGEEMMASAKEEDIESAVEKILSGTGLEATGGADAPTGDVEKSYEDSGEGGQGGDNPALSVFYNE